MMDDSKKTLTYIGVALSLAVIAFLVSPKQITPDAFTDQGESFFPDFTDPNSAASLEVIAYDEETGRAIPFKVANKDGLWTIPSQYDYPADGAERLANTAAGLIQLKRDEYRTGNVNDYEDCGVIDPLDELITTMTGRGQRVTVKGPDGSTLADLIIGKQVASRPGFRFVRSPSERRVYAAKVDLDISTKFADWIDTTLFDLNKKTIDRVVIDNYSVNERTFSVEPKERTVLTREGKIWRAEGLKSTHQVDTIGMEELLSAIAGLTIAGVREKPETFSRQLSGAKEEMSLTQSEVFSLQRRGFFLSRDGQILANEGELQVQSSDGISYQLRFGEVTYTGEIEADNELDGRLEESNENVAEYRFLFVSARFDETVFNEPSKHADESFLNKADSLMTDADRKNKTLFDAWTIWQKKIEKGREDVRKLNARFANWFYLISADSFESLRVPRRDLIVTKTSDS